MDGLPIVLALFVLNVTNPGRLLYGRHRDMIPDTVGTPQLPDQARDEEKA